MKPRSTRSALVAALAILASSMASAEPRDRPSVVIPESGGPSRSITTSDLLALREIDALSVSRDGRRFAILVRQADVGTNGYRTAWYAGDIDSDRLVYIGDGGDARLLIHGNGVRTGDFSGNVARWSPDGRWIAFTAMRDGEVQLWKGSGDGRTQQQLTHNEADVLDFTWSDDGRAIVFSTGRSRAEIQASREARSRTGYRLEEFFGTHQAFNPAVPEDPPETATAVWRVSAEERDERLATDAQRAEFESARARQFEPAGSFPEGWGAPVGDVIGPPVVRADGASAWRVRSDASQKGSVPNTRPVAVLSAQGRPIPCVARECVGQFFAKIWWSGDQLVFWRRDGEELMDNSFYAWSPAAGTARTILSSSDAFKECQLAGPRILCLRETQLVPRHVVSIDIASGRVKGHANVNPEFQSFRLGRIEHIKWETAADPAGIGYPRRARGVLLYPPDYDPSRKYPLFIAPYAAAEGFLRGDVGNEHPLLAYSANGFIVLASSFPVTLKALATIDGTELMPRLYDRDKGFPHLTMLAESTFLGLDAAIARGGIDERRVGTGGVSHGAFVPLFMVQIRDRLTALSVGSPGWQQGEYYGAQLPAIDAAASTVSKWHVEAPEFWAGFDLADHLDQVEAPILFHFADREVAGGLRLVRRLRDAKLPVEAYSFPNELHLKWQPAHTAAVYDRNLDWFRFWLQDIEDPAPAKQAQYARWRQLREQQCRNPRSLRAYCGSRE